jgi:nucleotidyltransferase substrate binding protein (TIGR01987 family)
MEEKDILWIQRFDNVSKIRKLLGEALKINEPSLLQKAGIIHYFEMCYQQSFNMLILYLNEQGFVKVRTARSAIKKAFEIGLIADGSSWMELIEDIKFLLQVYEEEISNKLILQIRFKYFPLLKELSNAIKPQL